MQHVRTLRELDYHERSDTLLLGYDIASADTERGTLTIIASGKTVRFLLAGHAGHVDLDLTSFAAAAYAWLTRNDAIPRVGSVDTDTVARLEEFTREARETGKAS